MENIDLLYDSILNGNLESAVEITNKAINADIPAQTIINDYMIKAMEEIGARFEAGTAYVPNLLMSARAMKGSLELLKPLMKSSNVASMGKVVIGTVKGDLHDIGKNLVCSMLEGCGFEVINLGVDITSDMFIEAAKKHKADIVCMSALLTTTMTYMKEVINAFDKEGLRGTVKIMVGGAPLNETFAEEIHADGYSDNANSAVALAKRLMKAS